LVSGKGHQKEDIHSLVNWSFNVKIAALHSSALLRPTDISFLPKKAISLKRR
jgi:hypothetical protein